MENSQLATRVESQSIKIAILDDESLFVSGISSILKKYENIEIVMQHTNGQSFLDELETIKDKPEILLLDLNMMPLNGVQILDELAARNSDIKVLVISSHYNPAMYGYMIKYGISGFLPKHTEESELIKAIESIHKWKFYLNEENQNLLNSFLVKRKKNCTLPWQSNALTDREIEVLRLICKEYSTKEIAQTLFISIKTVEAHRSKIIEKLCCKNVIGMVIYAIVNGIHAIDKED